MSKRFYWKKIRPILLSVLICCLFFMIIIGFTSNRNGNLTIFVDKYSLSKSLSLSENKNLSNPQGKLYGPSLENAWDTIERLVPNDLNLYDGANNGDFYIAYTFYVFNSSRNELDYTMKFNIDYKSNDLDEAIRVKLYVNDVPTTYAKKNSSTGEAEDGTVAFESESTITSSTVTDLAPKEYTKYTIVMWIESTDIDCTNDKIGGALSISMAFSVIEED